MELRVARKFRVGPKIGSGSFGEIYGGVNVHTGEEVAIKLEPLKTKHPQLIYESKIYRVLQGGQGIPSVKWFGSEGDYNVLVIDLLGPSLEDLFNYCNKKLTLKTVLLLADQMISRLEFMHSRSYIHRDVKPENILLDANGTPYLCDFGISIIGTPGKLAICKSTSGTLPYLAPEVLTESHCHSYESDFWGLGLTAYELRFKSQLFPHVPRSFVDYLNRVYLHIWSILESTIENPDFDPSTFNFQEFANNLLVSDENLKTLSSQEFYNSMDFDLPIIDDGQISQCFKAFIYEILDLRPHMRLGNLNEFEIRFKNHQFFQNYGINFDQLSTIFSERNNNEEHGDNDAYYPYFDRIQEKLIHKNLRESITDYLTLRSNIPIQLEQKLRNNFIYSPEHHE
mmetsp:Transcript_14694/g.15391  ORF Transcript_14694/g.15391 Transcript_14694/m.15391 type:complete len:397 (+) Transcript_14694:94-1284(+)